MRRLDPRPSHRNLGQPQEAQNRGIPLRMLYCCRSKSSRAAMILPGPLNSKPTADHTDGPDQCGMPRFGFIRAHPRNPWSTKSFRVWLRLRRAMPHAAEAECGFLLGHKRLKIEAFICAFCTAVLQDHRTPRGFFWRARLRPSRNPGALRGPPGGSPSTFGCGSAAPMPLCGQTGFATQPKTQNAKLKTWAVQPGTQPAAPKRLGEGGNPELRTLNRDALRFGEGRHSQPIGRPLFCSCSQASSGA